LAPAGLPVVLLLLLLLLACIMWQVPVLLLLLLLLPSFLLAVLCSQESSQAWALCRQQLLLVALRCSPHVLPHLPPAAADTISDGNMTTTLQQCILTVVVVQAAGCLRLSAASSAASCMHIQYPLAAPYGTIQLCQFFQAACCQCQPSAST
jgi:hypothetical protein